MANSTSITYRLKRKILTFTNSFTLRYYTRDMNEPSTAVKTQADYKQVLKYLDSVRRILGEACSFLCGYEAGCLGYTLYHQLQSHDIECVILAPTTIPETRGKKKVKNDKRDAGNIATCLANRSYRPVHIPSEQDEEIKEYIRMRSDHKTALKKVKQQILSFCLRHGCRTDFADIQNKKECGGNRQWQNHYLRNWAANTKGKGII